MPGRRLIREAVVPKGGGGMPQHAIETPRQSLTRGFQHQQLDQQTPGVSARSDVQL